eukprot:gene5970-11331_t
MAKKLKERKISIVPGKKICPSCGKDINETLINEHEEALPHSDEELLDFEANLDGDRNREILNSSLIEEDISPLKLHAVASHSRVAHGKRKIAQVQSRFRQKQLDLQITMAKAIDVEPRELDLKTNKGDSEVKVRFLHPKCPARSYFWPEREVTCWLPDEQVIQNLQVLSTSTGRQYKLSNDDEKILSKLLKNI